jgi:SAM-dependent methyltransferase
LSTGRAAPDRRTSYRVSQDPEQVRREQERLGFLAQYRDPMSHEALRRTGLSAGWRCLEVGAGAGSITQWLSEQVGPAGRIVAVDIDTRLHPPPAANTEIRQLDVTREPLGIAAYDLVHSRALLQHLHQREAVLDAMVAALRPGGWIVVEDSDFTPYLQQTLPEPFGSVSRRTLELSRETNGWDGTCGSRLLGWLQQRGLEECDATGRVFTMHGGTPSAEWYVAGLDRAHQHFVDSGRFTAHEIHAAVAQARRSDFAVLSPISISAIGRRPV